MSTPTHTCPATRTSLPCWRTSTPVAAPTGTTSHFTFAALVEMLHSIQGVATDVWASLRSRNDFVYGGVEYRVTS